MFQDYCLLHGMPCIPGTLYCSEECRMQELEEVIIEENRRRQAAEPEEGYLMYECSFCRASYGHSQECPVAEYDESTHNFGKGNSLVDLPEGSQLNDIRPKNDPLQSNYRKWLTQMCY